MPGPSPISTPVIQNPNVTSRKNNLKKKPTEGKNEDLGEQLSKLITEIQSNGGNSPELSLKLAELVKKEVLPKLNYMSPMEYERQKSVVISGIMETDPKKSGLERRNADWNAFYSIADALDVDATPQVIYRLGNRNSDPDKPRLLKVVLATRTMQNALVQAAPKLRGFKGKSDLLAKVFLRPSLTFEQRQIQKELVKELQRRRDNGEDVVIHKNMVVLRNQVKKRAEKKKRGDNSNGSEN